MTAVGPVSAAVHRLARAGGERVLDLGPGRRDAAVRLATGDGRTVTCAGVDADELADAKARGVPHVVEVDADDPGWVDGVSPGPYDVVILGDLLSLVREPAALLRALAADHVLLAAGGDVVVSLPNISHRTVIADLVQGEFRYREAGIPDPRHVRFFTRSSFRRLAEDAGHTVVDVDRVTMPDDPCTGPPLPEVIDALHMTGPDSRTSYFVMRLRRTADVDGADPPDVADELERRLRQARDEVHRLEHEARLLREEHSANELQSQRRLEELQTAMRDMEETVGWRVATRYYRAMERLAPRGSSRRAWYARTVRRLTGR